MKESTAKPKFDLIMELNQPTLPTNNTQNKKKLIFINNKNSNKNEQKKNLHQHSPRTKKHLFVKTRNK